jgi:hypothetical protein
MESKGLFHCAAKPLAAILNFHFIIFKTFNVQLSNSCDLKLDFVLLKKSYISVASFHRLKFPQIEIVAKWRQVILLSHNYKIFNTFWAQITVTVPIVLPGFRRVEPAAASRDAVQLFSM